MARGKKNPNGLGGVTYDEERKRYVVTVPTGQRYASGRPKVKREYFERREEADRRHRELTTARERGENVGRGKLRFSKYLEQWLEHQNTHNRAKTWAFYEANVRLHIAPALGALDIRNVRALDCQRLLDAKVQAGLKPNTVRGIKRTLTSALNTAIDWGLISINPASRAKTPAPKKVEARALSQAQVQALLAVARETHYGPLVRLLLSTGMRVGEACGLRWSDVDLAAGVIRVRTQLQRDKGAGLRLVELKSMSSRRDLPLEGAAKGALESAKGAQILLLAACGVRNELDLVFLTEGARPLDPKLANDKLKALALLANERLSPLEQIENLSAHMFRHTAATMMLKGGVPVTVVKDMLGHSSILLTTGTYDHVMPSAMREAGRKLQELIGE